MRTFTGSFEILYGRGPAPAGIKEILLRFSGKFVVRNLILLEPALVADLSSLMSKIKLSRWPVADRAGMIFLAQRLHDFRKIQRRAGIGFANQLPNQLLALSVAAFAKMA